MKVIKTDSKKKSPKTPPRTNKSLDNYKKFLGNNNTVTKDNKDTNKDKKMIHVKRKKNTPRISRSKDIQDINDIEQKMIQMKQNKIQVPTQNVSKPILANKIADNPSPIKPPQTKPIQTKSSPKKNTVVPSSKPKMTKPNRQVTRVRISDIDVSENRLENNSKTKPQQQKPQQQKPQQQKPQQQKPQQQKPQQQKPQQQKPQQQKHKSNKRSNHRSNRRSKSKPNRKVSVKTLPLDEDKIKKVESRIKEIRGKKTDEIRKELEKQGLKVSGKSNRLLRDIYLYSKVCNINIHHEK